MTRRMGERLRKLVEEAGDPGASLILGGGNLEIIETADVQIHVGPILQATGSRGVQSLNRFVLTESKAA